MIDRGLNEDEAEQMRGLTHIYIIARASSRNKVLTSQFDLLYFTNGILRSRSIAGRGITLCRPRSPIFSLLTFTLN